jgi:hypothetical protein
MIDPGGSAVEGMQLREASRAVPIARSAMSC